jgi:hypothetical protein
MHKIVRFSVIAAVTLLGLIAVVAAQNSSVDTTSTLADGVSASANEAPTIIGGDDNILRELLARVIATRPYLKQQPVVYAGNLPEKMPFDLPLPEKTRLIGSIVYSNLGDMQMLLDADLPPVELVAFFHNSLDSNLWTVVENFPYPGYRSGFVSELATSTKFCYQNGLAAMTIYAQAQPQQTASQVQIDVTFPGDAATCFVRDFLDLPFSLLPQLQTPDGVTLLPGNGNGSGGTGLPGFRSGSISALLYSTLPMQDIADAYNHQLVGAGWQKTDAESGGHLSWSGWTLKDTDGKSWSGTFLLTANPTVEDQYTAQVMIQELAAK